MNELFVFTKEPAEIANHPLASTRSAKSSNQTLGQTLGVKLKPGSRGAN